MNVSSSQSATAFGYSQIQRQQAQRNAEQLEARAAMLAAQASSARKEADNADRRAGQLEIQSGTARISANGARLAVSTAKSAIRAGETIGVQAERIAKSLQSGNKSNTLYGQNGQSSPSSYKAGSLFKLVG